MKLHELDGSQEFQFLPRNEEGGWTIKDCSTTDRIITFSVRTPDGGTVQIQKNPHCRIIDVKRTLQKIVQFPATRQLLLVGNEIRENKETIFKCCITEESDVEVKEVEQVDLHVKCLDGEVFSLNMSTLNNVEDTIKEIVKMKNLTGHLSLWLGDKMIENDTKLLSLKEKGQVELGIDCFQLFAYVLRDAPIHLKVNSSDTIIDIKSRIQDQMVGVSITNDKVVISRSEEVDDSSTITKYLVNGVISFYILDKESFYITIKSLTGKCITFNTDPTCTVEKLKDLICEIERTPPDQQRLVFGGMQLEDGRTLHEYNIQCGSVVHIVLRLRGGAPGLYVLDNTGHSVLIEVYAYDTVEDVKNRIEKRLGIPPDQQELVIYDERIMGKRDERRNENDNKSCLIA